ncbi:hypothetical protein KUCAC02_029318 [Chaenocephalus aceratus]|uniref:Uncharacterized protein n=1 Tax=Chaenocephalus aceratus TaxID=36190 RepID=A0ACB9X539_CHAAC|nr:hypothetical protein KUCAC02_029318 [Chaenocephalus aceratus]
MEDTPNTPVCMEDTPNTPVCMEDTHGNHSKSSRDRKRQPCGTLLREMTEHTYHLQDEKFMCTVISRLNDILEDVKRHTPHDSSLPPTFTPPKHKRQERTITPLSTSHRRHHFSGRVHHKAEVMRSNYRVDSLNKISKAKSPESNAGGAGRGTKRRGDASGKKKVYLLLPSPLCYATVAYLHTTQPIIHSNAMGHGTINFTQSSMLSPIEIGIKEKTVSPLVVLTAVGKC